MAYRIPPPAVGSLSAPDAASRLRLIVLATLILITVSLAPVKSVGQDRALEPPDGLAAIKQWTAEVIVTSDCDRMAFDGSKTVIHNRVATTYQFTSRVAAAPVLTWRGRASTTYRWSVTMGGRDGYEVEESAATFDLDSELQIGDGTRISTTGRPPARPFTKTRYVGDTIVDSTTNEDWPPTAELFDAPLPDSSGMLSGRRAEASYSLFGGIVLTCPAQRQWTLHTQ
jgi:hypothetical protein